MQKLSNYLLMLSRGALEKSSHDFKDWALSETKNIIPFDSCVWGMGSWINDTPAFHTIHLHNLAEHFLESWMRFQHEDKVARDVTMHNNRTFNVDVANEYGNTSIYNVHCKDFCIEHIIATGTIDPDTRLINTMVFYRSNINQPFTEQERALKEIIFQHLVEAARTNWLTNLPNMFSAYQRSSLNALSACNDAGLLHIAMPSFVAICQEEWLSWKGPFLPPDVLDVIHKNQSYVGQSIVISIFKINKIILLRARYRVPADTLSIRELEIANSIADGNDHKTIAINLGISPATVRTHTTNLYLKLGVNDKAKLASELGKMVL